MTLTPEEWETELESVDQVAARDTEPAPPPTEPHHAIPTPAPAFEVVSAPRPLEPGDHTCGGYGSEPCLACEPVTDACPFCGELFEHLPHCSNFGVFK
ncbi:MAG TPA: hypothetical protein VGI10_10075 [Polyangiaceae bacterium]|jgi:hypothetical protein